MVTASKVDNRGGRRPGAGRKPETLSANQVRKMLRKAKKWAKKAGRDIDDILLGMIYGLSVSNGEKVSVSNSDRIACIKLWKEYTIAKLQEGGETDKGLAPAVFLPEHRPQLTGVEGKKAA